MSLFLAVAAKTSFRSEMASQVLKYIFALLITSTAPADVAIALLLGHGSLGLTNLKSVQP